MDLHRTLRVSLYLLAGSGAFAISVAERSLFHLALIVTLGVLAYFLIDRGKIKPLNAELTAALTVALLFITLRPLRDDDQWQNHFPSTVAHFLCAWQGLLFFSVYSGPVLLTFCGFTLAVVVMSGVIQPGPSLALRMALFVGLAAWTLYIHALWRSRQEFSGRASMLLAVNDKISGGKDRDGALRQLPEHAFWSTVWLVGGLTAACLALGTAIFFSAPRMEGVWAFFDRRGTPGTLDSPGLYAAGRSMEPGTVTGIGRTVSLNQLGRIVPDSRAAMKAIFSKPISDWNAPRKALLLKSASLSEYSNGQWVPDEIWEPQESRAGEPLLFPRDPSRDGPVYSGEEIRMSVETGALRSNAIFSAGPVLRAGVKRLEFNREGSLRALSERDSIDQYTLIFSAPLPAEKVPARAKAEHRDLRRYVLRCDVGDVLQRSALEKLARQITSRSLSDVAKAQAIGGWLRQNCGYTRDFEEIHASGDPLAHFLLSPERSQRRGHCGMFASAFVMLARLSNLPARICMGFAVSINPNDKSAVEIVAKNSDAHAWAEIYFKDLGWVAFDPTPPDSEALDAGPLVAAAKNAASRATTTLDAQPAAQSIKSTDGGLMQSAWNAVMNYNGREQRLLYERLSGSRSDSGIAGLLSGKGWGGMLVAAVLWGAMAVAVFWLVQAFVKRGRRKKFAYAATGGRSRAAVGFYNDLLHALSRRGFTRKPCQTPREFAESVVLRGGEAFAPAREITRIFEAVRYGRSELNQEEFNRLQDALDRIKESLF